MEQLGQYSGNATNLRDLDLSVFRTHNENLTSCTALAVEFDAVYFLAKAVLCLSNQLINLRYPSLEDTLLYTIILSHIPKPFLLLFLRSDLPSARAAQGALLELSSWQGDVQTFRLLATANDGYLQQQLGSSARFIHAAARLGQRDMVQSCLASMTALPESLEILTDLLGAEAAAVSVLAARTLTRLFDIRRLDIWAQLTHRYSGAEIVNGMRRWNHSVATILLEAGFDVDVAYPRSLGPERVHRLYDLNHFPVPWRMSILDYQYYTSEALHAVMQPYSLRSGTVFDREGLSGAGREGVQALSIYLSRWRADSEGHGRLAQFLQLFLVEQICFKNRELDWLEMVHSLSADSADIATCGPHALVQALRWGNTKAVHWLVERGVDPLHPIQDGKGSCFTVLGAAIDFNYTLPAFAGLLPRFTGPAYTGAAGAVLDLVRSGVRPLFRPNDASPIDFLMAVFDLCRGLESSALARHEDILRPLCREALQLPSNKALQLLEYIAILEEWDFFEEIASQGQLVGPGNPLAMLILYKAPPVLIRKMIRITPDHNARMLSHFQSLSASEAAAQVWNVQLLRELVLAGSEADRGVSDIWTNCSLQNACVSNTVSAAEAHAQIETVQYLLELGVPIDGYDKPNMELSPLQMASSNGSLELVLLLLNHGADVNIIRWWPSGERVKSLDLAAERGRLDVVQALLNAGATSYTTRSTPFDGAIDNALDVGHDETAKLLCRYALSKGLRLCQEHLKLVS